MVVELVPDIVSAFYCLESTSGLGAYWLLHMRNACVVWRRMNAAASTPTGQCADTAPCIEQWRLEYYTSAFHLSF